MSKDEHRPIVSFESRLSAEIVQRMLSEANIATYVVAGELAVGVATKYRLLVSPADYARARFVLSNSEFTDSELTYLATGELGVEDES